MENSRPWPRTELTQGYTHLEVGLGWAISISKGCNTRQEVIVRQIAYEKITKGLAGNQADGAFLNGSRVTTRGKTIGKITSVIFTPRHGHIGLAIVQRNTMLGTDTELHPANHRVYGICNIPFHEDRSTLAKCFIK